MNSIDIMECNDAETLKKIVLAQMHTLNMVGEVCVNESKMNYSSEIAIERIRTYLNCNRNEMEEFEWHQE